MEVTSNFSVEEKSSQHSPQSLGQFDANTALPHFTTSGSLQPPVHVTSPIEVIENDPVESKQLDVYSVVSND